MRNLVLILIAFIAVITFIRVFDMPADQMRETGSESINSAVNY
jgi:hypothetical protein